MMTEFEWTPALPEIFVATMACAILMLDLMLSERSRHVSFWLAQATLVGAAFLTLRDFAWERQEIFSGMFIADGVADVVKMAVYIVVFVVFMYSRDYLRDRGGLRGEYFVLGLFGVLGMMVMASAGHMLTLYLGLELLALCMYAMVAFQRDSVRATEAAMKYFVLGALASGLLLYGMSILYGLTGSLHLAEVRVALGLLEPDSLPLAFGVVFVIVAVGFKLGAVPFHMWVPDVYDGAATSMTAYLGAASKLASFVFVLRLVVDGMEDIHAIWRDMLVILALLSVITGNVLAIAQTNIKRMLAYSSIAHMGFFLLGILAGTQNGYSSAFFYILVYSATSLGVFGVILMLARKGFESDRLDDFRGLAKRSPWHAFVMLLLMFSMAGVPPTVGFYAKFAVIQAVVQVGLVWVGVVAVVAAVVGAFYYLRVVKLMYFDAPQDETPVVAAMDIRVLIGLNGIAVLAVMPWIGLLMDLCNRAVATLY